MDIGLGVPNGWFNWSNWQQPREGGAGDETSKLLYF